MESYQGNQFLSLACVESYWMSCKHEAAMPAGEEVCSCLQDLSGSGHSEEPKSCPGLTSGGGGCPGRTPSHSHLHVATEHCRPESSLCSPAMLMAAPQKDSIYCNHPHFTSRKTEAQ